MARVITVDVKTVPARVRDHADRKARRERTALALSAVAVTPLLLFAALWTTMLVFLGALWFLEALGLT
jgi:hypothetical protein